MRNTKILCCEIGFPTIYDLKNNKSPYMNKLEKELEDYHNEDVIIDDFIEESFLLVEECNFPEKYEDGIGEYYIDEDTYMSLENEEQKNYELWEGRWGSYYIPVPIINIETNNYGVPTTMYEQLANVGMSYKDFA